MTLREMYKKLPPYSPEEWPGTKDMIRGKEPQLEIRTIDLKEAPQRSDLSWTHFKQILGISSRDLLFSQYGIEGSLMMVVVGIRPTQRGGA